MLDNMSWWYSRVMFSRASPSTCKCKVSHSKLTFKREVRIRGCTVTGNSHFLTFLRLLSKDTQTKWRPQTTDRRYSPLSHSVKVLSHEQGLQILLLKPTNELKPMRRLCSSSAGFVPLSLRAPPSHTPAESAKRQLHVFFAS